MAEVLDAMPKRKGRATLHPWDEWTDGQVRKIVQGEDFSGKLEPMRVRLYSKARELGKKLEIDVDRSADEITFQIREKTPAEIAAEAAAKAAKAAKAEAEAKAEADDQPDED